MIRDCTIVQTLRLRSIVCQRYGCYKRLLFDRSLGFVCPVHGVVKISDVDVFICEDGLEERVPWQTIQPRY